MENLAILTGAKVFSSEKGDKLETATIQDLGKAEKFICRREESIIIGPKGKKVDIAMAITSLKRAIENEKKESIKNLFIKRLGTLTGMVAAIKVGALTEGEQKSLKYKVEDAVNSVKSAFKHGVVCGAGRSLAQIKTSSSLLNKALKAPSVQLMESAGLPDDLGLDDDHVMNLMTGETGPFMGAGVIDSADVVLAGVESAISVALTLLTSSGIIVESQKESKGG
ncbi:MAG: hypothetical protein AAB969_02655 [Patescibacteria group bacterium]